MIQFLLPELADMLRETVADLDRECGFGTSADSGASLDQIIAGLADDVSAIGWPNMMASYVRDTIPFLRSRADDHEKLFIPIYTLALALLEVEGRRQMAGLLPQEGSDDAG